GRRLASAASTAATPPGKPREAAAPPRGHPAARLPVQLTRFFGREEETTRLVELLTSGVTRLVTLTGPGGSGKTRLATAVAGRLWGVLGWGCGLYVHVDPGGTRGVVGIHH